MTKMKNKFKFVFDCLQANEMVTYVKLPYENCAQRREIYWLMHDFLHILQLAGGADIYVCPMLGTITGLTYLEKERVFTEFFAQKPSLKHVDSPWWPDGDLTSRIKALQCAIELTYKNQI